ncbi:hypothetical protein SAMN02745166_00747 [Prosthecobacter debontii]|uniref:Purple acid Phosphatase, N-terminal domain n=1 Tax=Prosthecobacter debontii TaxID=48467 RepID=A0A1T4WW36_9BACT|nr:hypothetical protein [Prosthecobacter debontii]SKA81347.1 hypothetical protein SAMN02745166_00747 [Prosthecobacter debontii]
MMKLLLRILAGMLLTTPLLAVELVGPPEVKAFEDRAILSWKTDVACGTRVNYGFAADKLDQKVEGGVSSDHVVELIHLKAGTTYHYKLGSARQQLYVGRFVTDSKGQGQHVIEVKPEPPSEKKSLLAKVWGLLSADDKPEVKAPPSPAQPRAPPTHETWGRMETLQDHFIRHGPDFRCLTADEYAAQAWQLLQRAKSGDTLMKWDSADATLRVFDPQTRAFAAYNRDGTTKTYFRPQSSTYWQRQPGKPIQPENLSF